MPHSVAPQVVLLCVQQFFVTGLQTQFVMPGQALTTHGPPQVVVWHDPLKHVVPPGHATHVPLAPHTWFDCPLPTGTQAPVAVLQQPSVQLVELQIHVPVALQTGVVPLHWKTHRPPVHVSQGPQSPLTWHSTHWLLAVQMTASGSSVGGHPVGLLAGQHSPGFLQTPVQQTPVV